MITHGYSQDKIQEVIGYHQTTILYLSRINIMWYLSLSLPRLSPKIFLVILLENAKNHKALNVLPEEISFDGDILTLSLPEWIMEFCKVFLNFDSVDEILWSDHSNETSLPVISHGAIWLSKFYKMKFLNFWWILLLVIFGSERCSLGFSTQKSKATTTVDVFFIDSGCEMAKAWAKWAWIEWDWIHCALNRTAWWLEPIRDLTIHC